MKKGIPLHFYIKVGFKGVYIAQTCFPDEQHCSSYPQTNVDLIFIKLKLKKFQLHPPLSLTMFLVMVSCFMTMSCLGEKRDFLHRVKF